MQIMSRAEWRASIAAAIFVLVYVVLSRLVTLVDLPLLDHRSEAIALLFLLTFAFYYAMRRIG
jgi:hypothetical protein